eukprot:GFYU01002109.1.p1 GENE.GFYU01002109.1~~GFYU01002109.1.p1  ORF type:complete len:747 (+),score=223.69 GFYU01002109.1:49-2241(+)
MAMKKPKFRIQPFKTTVMVDPDFPDRTWNVIKEAITSIIAQDSSGLSFEELYRSGYNMVVHKKADQLYEGLTDELKKHANRVAHDLANCHDDTFLRELTDKWTIFKVSMSSIRDILMYMDRTYVLPNKKLPVYDLGVKVFHDNIESDSNLTPRILNLPLGMIERERNGEVVDRGLIKRVTQMLCELGKEVYVQDFETHLLTATTAYYQDEAQRYITTNSCPDYLKKAEARLKEEVSRVSHYLDMSTEAPLKERVERELIKTHMATLLDMETSGIFPMFRDDKLEDLGRMYELFKRVPSGLLEMKERLSTYLKEKGKLLVSDPEVCKEPATYIQSLIDLRDKYEKIVVNSFANDRNFQHAVNTAFESFINQNNRSPEFLSLFLNEKLTKGLKGISEDEIETMLDKVMMLFRYIEEKDMFEKYYKQHLAKRLLTGRSMSDDSEQSFIRKLKTECGFQFTSKLEGMFTDMRLSHDAMDGFKNMLSSTNTSLGVEMNVHVLTTGFWPTQPAANCHLPQEVLQAAETFSKHYLGTHTGRKLTWQTNMGTADIKCQLGKEKHELNVSTYQMCILLLFNSAGKLSYNELAEGTNIPAHELKRQLQSLACSKWRVLAKEPRGKEIGDNDVFCVNEKFTCKLYRVKIGTVAQKETEVEKKETRQKVDEDRKPQIDAAVVRIMKSRKQMDHNLLIAEVTSQLQTRFMPNPNTIKQRIETLIEREFLERSLEDRRLYKYLA